MTIKHIFSCIVVFIFKLIVKPKFLKRINFLQEKPKYAISAIDALNDQLVLIVFSYKNMLSYIRSILIHTFVNLNVHY